MDKLIRVAARILWANMKVNIFKIVKLLIITVVSIVVILIVLSFVVPMGFGTIGTNIVLSHDKPRSVVWGIELLAISNQNATIKINKTGEVVSANKGDRFECKRYKALYLIEISGDKGEVLLRKYNSAPVPVIKGITYKEKGE